MRRAAGNRIAWDGWKMCFLRPLLVLLSLSLYMAQPCGTVHAAELAAPSSTPLFRIGASGLEVLSADRIVSTLALPGEGLDLLQVDSTLYIASSKGLLLIDVRDPLSPRHVGTLYPGQALESLSMQGTTLFARTPAAFGSRTVSFDVSESQKPTLRSDGRIDQNLEGSIYNPLRPRPRTSKGLGILATGITLTAMGLLLTLSGASVYTSTAICNAGTCKDGRFVGKAILGVAGTHLGVGIIMIGVGGYQYTHPND